MPRKGHKSTKGVGDLWGEPKKNRININLTDTGKRKLEDKANELEISVSELIERIARGELMSYSNNPFKKNWIDVSIHFGFGTQILQEHQNEIS